METYTKNVELSSIHFLNDQNIVQDINVAPTLSLINPVPSLSLLRETKLSIETNLSGYTDYKIKELSDAIHSDYFKLNEDNTINGENKFVNPQEFGTISVGVEYINFAKLYDIGDYYLSDLVTVSDTFNSMYSAINQIIAETGIIGVDFNLGVKVKKAFTAINTIAEKLSVPGYIPLDVETCTVRDGFNKLIFILDNCTIKLSRSLLTALKKIDVRFDLIEQGIAQINQDLSSLDQYVMNLDVDDKFVGERKIITELTQENGKIDYKMDRIVSSDVDGLVEYVTSEINKLDSEKSVTGSVVTGIKIVDGKVDTLSSSKVIDDFIDDETISEKKIKNLEHDLTSLSSNYVKKSGDTVAYLDVQGNLSVTNEGNITSRYFRTEDDGKIIFNGQGADNHGSIDITLENGINAVVVNGTSISGYVRNSINDLDVNDTISGKKVVITNLSETDGKISYTTDNIISSDVVGLSDYVEGSINNKINTLDSEKIINDGYVVTGIKEENGIITELSGTKITDSFINDESISEGKIKNLTEDLTALSSNYVKKSGDTIDFLNVVHDLSVSKLGDIKSQYFNTDSLNHKILFSGYGDKAHGTFEISVEGGLKSVLVNGTPLNTTFNDLSDVYLKQIDFKASNMVNDVDFTKLSGFNIYRGKESDLSNKIYLTYESREIGSIDCTDFVKDGFLNSVTVVYNEHGEKVMRFTWNTDSGKSVMDVKLADIAKDYVNGYGIKINGLSIGIDEDVVVTKPDFNSLQSDVNTISVAVDEISGKVDLALSNDIRKIAIDGCIESFVETDTVADVLRKSGEIEYDGYVRNNSIYQVSIKRSDGSYVLSDSYMTRDGVKFSNTDMWFIHEHNASIDRIPTDEAINYLTVIKTGVSYVDYVYALSSTNEKFGDIKDAVTQCYNQIKDIGSTGHRSFEETLSAVMSIRDMLSVVSEKL